MARRLNASMNPSTTSITNAHSAGSVSATNIHNALDAREVLCGAVSAATLKTLLDVTGQGEVPYLVAHTKDTTSRTVRCRVTVDGIVIFDATTGAITTNNTGLIVSGTTAANNTAGSNQFGNGYPISFNASLLVEIASSLNETDGVAIRYVLFMR